MGADCTIRGCLFTKPCLWTGHAWCFNVVMLCSFWTASLRPGHGWGIGRRGGHSKSHRISVKMKHDGDIRQYLTCYWCVYFGHFLITPVWEWIWNLYLERFDHQRALTVLDCKSQNYFTLLLLWSYHSSLRDFPTWLKNNSVLMGNDGTKNNDYIML